MARTEFTRKIVTTQISAKVITIAEDASGTDITSEELITLTVPFKKLSKNEAIKAVKKEFRTNGLVMIQGLEYTDQQMTLPVNDYISLSLLYERAPEAFKELMIQVTSRYLSEINVNPA